MEKQQDQKFFGPLVGEFKQLAQQAFQHNASRRMDSFGGMDSLDFLHIGPVTGALNQFATLCNNSSRGGSCHEKAKCSSPSCDTGEAVANLHGVLRLLVEREIIELNSGEHANLLSWLEQEWRNQDE